MRRARAARPEQTFLTDQAALTSIIEAMPAAVLVTDASGAVVFRNAAGAALAEKVTASYGPQVMPALRKELAGIIQGRVDFPVHMLTLAESDETTVTIDLSVARHAHGFVGVWADVTAAQALERASKAAADQLAASAVVLTGLGDEISASTQEVTSRASVVAAGSEQMSASIREIASSSAAASEGTATAVGAAGAAGDRLADLDGAVAKIGAVSNLITSIAEQTHLLALNATIEAARAGEAGRGFAVVAGEVKSLADRTREATDEITQMISAMEAASSAAVGSIGEIVQLIDQVRTQQTTVADAVREQAAVAGEMSQGITAVASAMAGSTESITRLREAADVVAARATELDSIVG